MVKINENTKCPECGSVWSKIGITKNYHKVLYRVCHDGCSCDNQVLIDYGYSHKHKLKDEMRKKRNQKSL